jgi:hypothetical protein
MSTIHILVIHYMAPQYYIWLVLYDFSLMTVATLLWPSVGVKPNTWKKLGLELSQP